MVGPTHPPYLLPSSSFTPSCHYFLCSTLLTPSRSHQVPRHGETEFSAFPRPPLPPRQFSQSRASLISPTSSVEADDERDSSWDYSDSAMDDLDERIEGNRYADEDTRHTSQKELWGWYSYGWAAEVFAICAMGRSCSLPHCNT